MKISFTDYQEWLDELLFVCDNSPEGMKPDLVRLTKETIPEKDGNGHEYNQVVLCGSFVFDGLPYEVFVDCGEEYISIKAGDGNKTYDRIAGEVKNFCGTLGLPVRRGRLVFEL